MSEPVEQPQPASQQVSESASQKEEPARPSRLRRFFLRHLPLSVAGLVILLSVTTIGLYYAASSAGFENYIRRQMVHKLETATGGRVEIASFHWHLLSQEGEAGGVGMHRRARLALSAG